MIRLHKRPRDIAVSVTIGCAALLGSAAGFEAFHGPTELIYSDAEKLAPGYLMFSTRSDSEDHQYTYLVDVNGDVVHRWKTVPPEYEGRGYLIEKTARLTESGSIIQGLSTAEHNYEGQRVLQELDWEGNLVWEFSDPREGYLYHHNFKRIWNNHLNDWTIIFTSRIPMTQEQAVAAGADPAVEWDAAPDGVVEVDREGNIVWEWWSLDHVIQDANPDWPNYGVLADHPERFDLNWGRGLRGDFTHQNALDYNRTLDQIVVSNSVTGEFYVIDHGGTFVVGDFEASRALAAGPKGDIIYRWGNPSVYDSGKGPTYDADGNIASEGDQQLFHHHDIQWIKEGLPGAGNFLVFNNGSRRAGAHRSELIEINPYAGIYPQATYESEVAAGGPAGQIVWNFTSGQPNSFFSRNISGLQRLPNGNTLALSGRHGHAFQVTPGGEVVWEYIVPILRSLSEDSGTDGYYRTVMSDSDDNSLFTAHWISPDHSGIAGRELIPQGRITEIATQ